MAEQIKMRTPEEMEFAKRIAGEAFNQIFIGATPRVYFTWGIDAEHGAIQHGWYKDMPTLKLRVNGLIYQGWVYVSLNTSKDLYEIRLIDENHKATYIQTDLYDDQIGLVIDDLVERKAEWSEEEYSRQLDLAAQAGRIKMTL